jgi:hypothetical protein
MHGQNPKGKSQEVNFLAAFVWTFGDSLGVSRPRLISDWTHASTKPEREVSGGKFPGRICADLSAIASEFQDPRRSEIGLIHRRNPKGKSQEVKFLAVFGTDLLAIASGF